MRTLNQPLSNSASAKRIVALGVSPLALVVALASLPSPASAQLMRLRAAPAGPAATGTPTAGTIQATSMRSALAQQASTQAREAALRSYATSIRQAVAASVPRANPANGLDPLGLYPVRQVRDLVGRPQAEITAGLQSLKAAADPTGKATWEGASVPVQTVDGSQTTVSITQTQERAVLSWNRMDVGAQTTLQFVQKDAAGNAQPGWIALNRVVDSTDPTTILGNIKADGAVYILNPRGVIFGKGAQVNLTSLVASTLEIGKFANAPRGLTSSQFEPFYTGASIQDRNTAFLLNGPFANNTLQLSGGIGLVPIFLSASIAPGAYDSNATALPAFAVFSWMPGRASPQPRLAATSCLPGRPLPMAASSPPRTDRSACRPARS
jgi:filamentous hemagglutinin family protein